MNGINRCHRSFVTDIIKDKFSFCILRLKLNKLFICQSWWKLNRIKDDSFFLLFFVTQEIEFLNSKKMYSYQPFFDYCQKRILNAWKLSRFERNTIIEEFTCAQTRVYNAYKSKFSLWYSRRCSSSLKREKRGKRRWRKRVVIRYTFEILAL